MVAFQATTLEFILFVWRLALNFFLTMCMSVNLNCGPTLDRSLLTDITSVVSQARNATKLNKYK